MVVRFKSLMILSCAILLKPAKSQYSFDTSSNFKYEIGFDAGIADPELKKNGCDTTISVVHSDYQNSLMIGGSTASKNFITGGTTSSGCEPANQMVPYVQNLKENLEVRWSHVFTDNGMNTYSDVALLTTPIESPTPEIFVYKRLVIVLKARTEAVNSHMICVIKETEGNYPNVQMVDYFPMKMPDSKLPSRHQFLVKHDPASNTNAIQVSTYQVFYASVEDNSKSEIVQMDFTKDANLDINFHTADKHRIFRYPMVDNSKFLRPIQSVMVNVKSGVERLMMGGSYWPNGASSDTFCPIILVAKIASSKLNENMNLKGIYLDCTVDSGSGPFFSIDVMSSNGPTLMYGLGVARDKDFNLVENSFMLIYQWKYIGTVDDNDHWFTGCSGSSNTRIIVTKLPIIIPSGSGGLPSQIVKPSYITHDSNGLIIGFMQYATRNDYDNNNPSHVIGLYTYRTIIDATCSNSGHRVTYASTVGKPKHSWKDQLKPCISTPQLKASGSCDASVFPAKTTFASTHMIYAYTSTYDETSELNSGGKVGMLYSQAGALNQECVQCETEYYEEWVDQNGNVFTQTTMENNNFGSPVSYKAEKGDYEMSIGPLNCYDDLTHYNKVSGVTMGCIDPQDSARCEIMVSSNTDDDFLNFDFTGSLKTSLPCNFKADSLYFSPSVSSLADANVQGQLVKRYGWWDSDPTFQQSDTTSQYYFDQFPPIHHPNINSDGTGFTVYACPKTAVWDSIITFEFYVIALVPYSSNIFVSLLEGDKLLKLTFTPWGKFDSSNSSFQLYFDSSDLANYIAQGGIYTTKWEIMTEAQKDANQQYQGLPEGEKFPYFTHSLKSGSSSTAPCNCDPIKLEAFTDEQMTSALSSTSSGYLQTFTITNSPDQSATPFVDIEINLKIPTYTEIWVKLTDKIGLKYVQKMIFSQCGAETFEQSFELTTPIEYDQNTLNDTAYNFQVVRPADIKSYFNLIQGGIAGQDPCEVEWMNMYTDVSCASEYSQASSDGTVTNHLQNSYVNSNGVSEQLVAVYTQNDYTPKVYYVKLRTQGLVESPCKPITFQVNVECLGITVDYSSISSVTKFYYEVNTGQFQIDLVPFLAHLGGLKNGKCSLDSSLAFQIKERKSDKGGVAQADLKPSDVQSLPSVDSVQLSTTKWAEKDSLMVVLNLDTDGFKDCIKNQNAQKSYGNCTWNVLVQFWSGQNVDSSYAFLELILNVYAPEPPQAIVQDDIQNTTVDLTKFIKQKPKEKVISVNPFLVNQESEEEILQETELGDQEDEMMGLNDEDVALLEQTMAMGIFDDEGGPPTVKFVRSFIPEWKTVADEEVVLQFLEEMKSEEPVDEIEEKVKPRDIKFEVSKISREGHIEILFNQKIKVPPFEEFWGKRRSLVTILRMADINVERDIVNITFALKSSLPTTALEYHLQIVDWTEDKIVVFMNFTNPGAVSQGDFRDGIIVEFKNLNWIKAAESREILKPENAKIESNSFPKQLPGAQKYEDNAQQASNSMKALLIIQIILQLLLKGSIDDTWNMFLILQLCSYAQIYDIAFPVNVEIYIEQFRSLIRFEILRPDKLLKFIDPDLSVDKLLGYVMEAKDEIIKGNIQSSGFESTSFLKNMIVYVFLVIICLLAIVGMLFLRCSEQLKPKVDKILRDALEKFFFNNYVRSITITYLETAISFKIICETLSFNIPLFLQLTIFPLCCAIALNNYRIRLDEPMIRKRMEKMYTNISMRKARKEPKIVFYYPIFMIRRFMFVMIPLLISNIVVGGNFHTKTYGSLQLYALILFSSFYIVQYGIFQPHDQQKLIVIEFFNETLFMILHYHMFFFTKFLDQHPLYNLKQGKISYGSGWSYLGCLVIIAVVNLANLGHATSQNIKRRQRLRRKKILILKQEEINIIIAKKLKEMMKNKRDSQLVNPFITKIQPEESTKSDIADGHQIKIKQTEKQKSDKDMAIDLENEIENLLTKMEKRSSVTKNRRNTEILTHKELREKKKKRNHLDTIKEEDSKLVDSDLMNQLPDFSMNLESARSKQQNLAKTKSKTVEPAEIAELDDMEKMMVEIEMTQKSNMVLGEQSVFASADETVFGGETLTFNEIDLSSSNKATPQISQQEIDKIKRRKTTEAQIKSVVNLKKTLRKRKSIKY